jgi:phosphoribosyl-ATP pyrophosphohydrolase/phosphoribosyl-AMP cyclohydrolase
MSEVDALDWERMDGLLPAVVQDAATHQLLMVGYMSPEALRATLDDGRVTFFSRSKDRLWTKGETSGNYLNLRAVYVDCDGDALLVQADPVGPTCHLGTTSCFSARGPGGIGWIARLAQIVRERAASDPSESYTARLLGEGAGRISQKIGEEGVEVALAGASGDRNACIEETADLIYHLTVLMEAREFSWDDVSEVLRKRHEG